MAGRGGRDGWWTKDDEKRLIEMSKEGYTRDEAASEFGCGIERISAKAHQLGIKMRSKLVWSPSEVARFKQLAESDKTADEIAAELNKSAYTVYTYARKYNIILKTFSTVGRAPTRFCTRWCATDDLELSDMVADKVSVSEIATALGRTPAAIVARMSRLGLHYKN